jgi:hypothetical protein
MALHCTPTIGQTLESRIQDLPGTSPHEGNMGQILGQDSTLLALPITRHEYHYHCQHYIIVTLNEYHYHCQHYIIVTLNTVVLYSLSQTLDSDPMANYYASHHTTDQYLLTQILVLYGIVISWTEEL